GRAIVVGLDDGADGPLGEVGWALGLVAFALATRIGGRRARPLAKRLVKGYLKASDALEGGTGGDADDALQDIYGAPGAAFPGRVRASEPRDGAGNPGAGGGKHMAESRRNGHGDPLTGVRRRADYNAAERRLSLFLQQRLLELLEGRRNRLDLLRK